MTGDALCSFNPIYGQGTTVAEVEQTAPLPGRAINRYMERLMASAAHDEVVARTFFEVSGMLRPPTALLTPPIARRVLRRRAVQHPEAQPPLTRGAEAAAQA